MPVALINLDSEKGQRALQGFVADPPVLLLGSAISAFAPTCLPAGRSFADTLFTFIFPEDAFASTAESFVCRTLFQRVPFEHVMEACPRSEAAQQLVVATLSSQVANPLHDCVATALVRGYVRAIVTPNYDRCLESVPGFASTVKRIVTSKEATGDVRHAPTYFKIHGSTEPEYCDSLVFSLRHETILPPWKRAVLQQILRGRTLLVAGYSGSDFEICPELQRVGCRDVYWTFRDAHELETRNNVRQLLSVVGGTVLVGDIAKLLGAVGRAPEMPVARWNPSLDQLRAELTAKCSEVERLEWRARLSIGMGCASLAARAVERRRELDPHWSRSVAGARVSGNASFHLGNYRQAFRLYRGAVRNMTEPLAARCGMRLEVAEALRCYGARLRALGQIELTRSLVRRLPQGLERTRLEGAVALRSALLGRGWYQIAELLHIPKVQDVLRPWLARRLHTAAEAAIAAGDRFNLHQIQLTADRMDVRFQDLVSDDSIGVPTKDGYQNLGYLIAESMSFRDAFRRRRSALSTEEWTALRRYIRRHQTMRNWPEVWKLSLLAVRLGPPRCRAFEARRAVRAFFRCQYSPLFRVSPVLWRS